SWLAIKQGIPVRVEIGPRDIAKGEVFVGRRDKGPKEKSSIPRAQFVNEISKLLEEIQTNLFERAKAFRDENTKEVNSLKEFEDFFAGEGGGFALASWSPKAIGHEIFAKLKVTPRCIPLKDGQEKGKCIFTGEDTETRVIFAKAY